MKSLTSLALILTLLLVGCGNPASNKQTVTLEDGTKGSVETQSDGSVKIESGDAKMEAGGNITVTEADIHAPFYPGADYKSERSFKMSSDTENNAMAVLMSTDPIDKIEGFYKEKMKGMKFDKIEFEGQITILGVQENEDGSKVAITLSQKKAGEPVEINMAYGKTTEKK